MASLQAKVDSSGFLKWFFTYMPQVLIAVAVIITIISGVDYFVKNKNSISTTK